MKQHLSTEQLEALTIGREDTFYKLQIWSLKNGYTFRKKHCTSSMCEDLGGENSCYSTEPQTRLSIGQMIEFLTDGHTSLQMDMRDIGYGVRLYVCGVGEKEVFGKNGGYTQGYVSKELIDGLYKLMVMKLSGDWVFSSGVFEII